MPKLKMMSRVKMIVILTRLLALHPMLLIKHCHAVPLCSRPPSLLGLHQLRHHAQGTVLKKGLILWIWSIYGTFSVLSTAGTSLENEPSSFKPNAFCLRYLFVSGWIKHPPSKAPSRCLLELKPSIVFRPIWAIKTSLGVCLTKQFGRALASMALNSF